MTALARCGRIAAHTRSASMPRRRKRILRCSTLVPGAGFSRCDGRRQRWRWWWWHLLLLDGWLGAFVLSLNEWTDIIFFPFDDGFDVFGLEFDDGFDVLDKRQAFFSMFSFTTRRHNTHFSKWICAHCRIIYGSLLCWRA